MNIEWEEPPEMQRGRNQLYAAFSDELRQHPKRWAKHPRGFATAVTAAASVSNQRRGMSVSLPKEEFEMVSRGNVVYVRYIGE